MRIAKKLVDAFDPRPGENSLTTHAAVFLLKISQQFHLECVARSEIGVAALAGKGMMAGAVPIKSGNAESGFRRDYGTVAFGIFGAFAQRDEIFGLKRVDSIGVGFQI